MRLSILMAASTFLAIVATSGAATAGSGGEELLALDLTPAGGGIYFLGCTTGMKNPLQCGRLSLWEQTNPIPGLQTSIYQGDQPYNPDNDMLS